MLNRIQKLFLPVLILLAFTSCNDDDPTGDAGPPVPTFLINGEREEPVTGNIVPWRTNAVTAELNDMGLFIEAADGNDTLFIAIETLDTLVYQITGMDDLSVFNRFETTDSDSLTTLFTFKADGSGGGTLHITSVDSVNGRFSGELMVEYFNPINNSDFFRLVSATLNNIPFQIPSGGDDDDDDDDDDDTSEGTITFSLDGNQTSFSNINASIQGTQLGITGNNGLFELIPSINFTFPSDIEPGTYDVSDPDLSVSYNETFSDVFLAKTGSVEVTAHDTVNNMIEATFNFSALNFANQEMREVTGGEFSITYIE